MYEYLSLLLNGVLTLAAGYAGMKFKEFHKREKARERTLREIEEAQSKLNVAMAKILIVRECNHYIRKGFAPLYAVDSIGEMYAAYHLLGGNGAITEIYKAFCALPHTKPEAEHEGYT